MEKTLDIIVPKDASGSRLDLFVAQRGCISRSQAAKLIRSGLVTIQGQTSRPSLKISQGMDLHITRPDEPGAMDIQPMAIGLDIRYEDQDIIVINKPPGLIVHPGAGNPDGTLVNALVSLWPTIRGVGDPDRPGIVHRLDKDTSGLMVMARTTQAYNGLVAQFKAHTPQKEYYAICHGHMPQDNGRMETFFDRHPKDRKRMSSRVSKGRVALTHWQVERRWPGISLLRLGLETGRTHQIRVHLADNGCPVVGDSLYGGKKRLNNIKDPEIKGFIEGIKRQMLHAFHLHFIHPITTEVMDLHIGLPDDMQAMVDLLDRKDV
ncbi:MAG: RluA family pseudouridine synthase [Thermodesulfobacteriota bacterium]|nr:RluA family pseudouridine synthase [Thermodesulfobacteriota bacterium]